MLAGIPILYAAGTLLGQASVVATIVWVVVLLALIVRHQLVRCPRCHEFFNWSASRRHTFTDQCLHCGLALDAE